MSADLAQRRQALVARSTAERAAIIAAAGPLLGKAATADRLYSRIRRHPVSVTIIGVAVAALGARKLFTVATRAMALYGLFRGARNK
jgi:hypothetical protein